MLLYIRSISFAGLLCLSLVSMTSAQDPQTAPESKALADAAAGRADASATVEMIMEQAVRNIARRYNLNEAQTEKTQEIMKRRVNLFLKEHENAVWPLIRDLLAAQLGTRPPGDIEDVKRIGKSAQPLVKLARQAIFEGNEEWRQYLNEEQKLTHDFDLAQMESTFQQIEKNFGEWAEGRPSDQGIFPPPPVANRAPPRPRDQGPDLPSPEIETFQATVFHTHVEEFIKDYELNPAQVDAARSILKEFVVKVDDFRAASMEEFTKLAADLKAAREARDLEKSREIEATRKKVLEPVYALFEQMDQRLRALLTTAQIERHASRQSVGEPTPREGAGAGREPAGTPAGREQPSKPEGSDSPVEKKPAEKPSPQRKAPDPPPDPTESQRDGNEG